MSTSTTPAAGFWRDPLFHFLGLALLIFLANALFAGDQRELITVPWESQEYLFEQEADLRLRPLTEQEKEEIVQNFIEDEILVREARRRGFDDSSRIRSLLVQNMRFFLKQDMPAPDEAELRSFFEDNPQLFRRPETVDYQQVYFENPDLVPGDTLEQLIAGADPAALGDESINFSRMTRQVTPRDIAATFPPESARAIVAIDDEAWHGPFPSDFGVHFLRVAARTPAALPEFEQVERWVQMSWMSDRQNAIMDEALAEMRQSYRVEVMPQPAEGAQ